MAFNNTPSHHFADRNKLLLFAYFLPDAIPESGPVSPSSVPLPSAPPPSSSKEVAKKKENGEMKVMSVGNPTPEQQQLQQQAQQYYHQQQLYYQQQVSCHFALRTLRPRSSEVLHMR